MNFSNNKAIYLQIVDDLCDKIASGAIKPLDKLPSVRELSALYQVNVNTVMRSIEYIQAKNIAENRRGIGIFVLPDAQKEILQLKRNDFLKNELPYFFRQMNILRLNPEELASMYKSFIENNNEKIN